MIVKVAINFITQSIIILVSRSAAQPTIQQYLHLTGLSPFSSNGITAVPIAHPLPTPTSKPSSNSPKPRPLTGLPSMAGFSIPNLALNLNPPNSEVKSDINSSIDSTLLNNLAIALQLLIVSNILNTPPAETTDAKSGPVQDVATFVSTAKENVPCYHAQPEQVVQTSNLIDDSSNKELNRKSARTSFNLMSPYEAISQSSKTSDPFSSQFDTLNPKRDLQSPYTMFSDKKDLFSGNDLFM